MLSPLHPIAGLGHYLEKVKSKKHALVSFPLSPLSHRLHPTPYNLPCNFAIPGGSLGSLAIGRPTYNENLCRGPHLNYLVFPVTRSLQIQESHLGWFLNLRLFLNWRIGQATPLIPRTIIVPNVWVAQQIF